MKPPFENPVMNYLYYTSTSPRERARQERYIKKQAKLKKKHVKRKIS